MTDWVGLSRLLRVSRAGDRVADRVCAPVVWALAAVNVVAAQGPAPNWLTGRDLERQLQQTVPVLHWRDAPLRPAVQTLARANRVAVLIDRRIDPGQPLTLSPERTPLREIFHLVAEERGLSTGWIGPVLYFGPPKEGPRLETILELQRDGIRKLSAAARRPWLRTASISWQDFAEPRQLLQEIAEEGGLELSGLQQVPHDLWAAADLPPLSLVDRLGLVVGQYDLTCNIDSSGRKVSLVPMPPDVALVRTYPGGREVEKTARQWREFAPAAQFKVVGEKIFVRGLLADHRRIEESMTSTHPERSTSARAGETRYTIREAKGTLGRLLEELAGRLELDLRRDDAALEAAGISLDQQVSLSVADVTLEELLNSLLVPAGCQFRLDGKRLVVLPAAKSDQSMAEPDLLLPD